MNRLDAEIIDITSSENISLVDLKANDENFSCVIIETPETADYLKLENRVKILFKETEVSIVKNFTGETSLRNRIKSTIKEIEKGKVLSKLVLDFKGIEIISVITSRSVERMNLKVSDNVTGMIKANEVSIMEI